MTASTIHYDGDMWLVVQFLHRNYLSTWRNTEAILVEARPYVKPNILADMERILTMGCPEIFNQEDSAENKEIFLRQGNNHLVERHKDVTGKNYE